MLKLDVETSSRNYPIYIEENFDNLEQCFIDAGFQGNRAFIITDSNVSELYLKSVEEKLMNVFSALSVGVVDAGEKSKNLDTVQKLYKAFFEHNLDRKSVVIALGGGVIGDIAGYAAATYMRGIGFVQIPTTLLSQVDSSIGGKTGVDYETMKNIIGAFYQPYFVYTNITTLKTLPKVEFSSGMAEIIKAGLIADINFLAFINHNREKILTQDPEAIITIIQGACKIKMSIVSADEKETGIRAALNFGHTFGHAIETFSQFQLPHGLCVGLGICSALQISLKYEYINEDDVKQIESMLVAYGLVNGLTKNEFITTENLLTLMKQDKKSVNGKIALVLLKSVGNAFIGSAVDEDDIIKAIEYILKDPTEDESNNKKTDN